MLEFSVVAVILASIFSVRFWRGYREAHSKQSTADTGKKEAKPKPTTGPLGSALFDALTNPFTWVWWAVILGIVWLLGPKVTSTPTWVWVPIVLWLSIVYFSRAKSASCEHSSGSEKNKKSHPALQAIVKHGERLAILSTIAVALYYGVFAPAGTWEEDVGVRSLSSMTAPRHMVYPDGLPRNPNFTSRKLEGWTATYVAANMHYRVPQSRFNGERLLLAEAPGRHIAEVIDLTIAFGSSNEALDIRLTGACTARNDTRRWSVSKTCGGEWIDRWRRISGKFYLEVKEGGGGQRYIDAYLYDGNNIPRKSEFAMFTSGTPIPHIMLQLRPKNWNMESQ